MKEQNMKKLKLGIIFAICGALVACGDQTIEHKMASNKKLREQTSLECVKKYEKRSTQNIFEDEKCQALITIEKAQCEFLQRAPFVREDCNDEDWLMARSYTWKKFSAMLG